MTRTLCLLFVCALTTLAQPVGFGIKGGVRFNQLFGNNGLFQSDTKNYIVGPMVELRLPAGFAIEGDALYSRVNFSGPLALASSVSTSLFDSNSWEFPIVLKKKFGGASAGVAAARPYVEAGASFRHLSGITKLPSFIGSGTEVDQNNTGFVVGAGVEIRALFLRISPEIRYTRWGTENFTSGILNVWRTNPNQGQFLIGINF